MTTEYTPPNEKNEIGLKQEIWRLNGVAENLMTALNHWRKVYDEEHGLRLVIEERNKHLIVENEKLRIALEKS